jgi:hypothetical protein
MRFNDVQFEGIMRFWTTKDNRGLDALGPASIAIRTFPLPTLPTRQT